jgi:SAM-dependent methyltransferase
VVDAGNVTTGGWLVENKDLKAKYDEMHKQGASAWYGDGREERGLIVKIGEPWKGLKVLEIGCGEGDLGNMIYESGVSDYLGLDYSAEAHQKACKKYPNVTFWREDYKKGCVQTDRIVLQGVIEHLDDPFSELQWMIEHFKPKTVITSSPCFLNPRGIVWMTLDMLGAVMSKTDLHYLHPWDFEQFCSGKGYRLQYQDCDMSWGNHKAMIEDLRKRIPLALKDGNLPDKSPERLLKFLSNHFCEGLGATMVYRIDI